MAAHIFTVNEKTFKVHLNYMFAGTGKDGASHQFGALADISSIRKNDIILFYVMNKGFYGFFKAKTNPFYENNTNQYLDNELGKTLTYRLLIEPFEVFSHPKSEWNVMENPKYIKYQSIFNMQWSWIFKKLNANRGCLSIDNHEFKLLADIIADKNIKLENKTNYDFLNDKITISNFQTSYTGNVSLILKKNIDSILIEEDLRIIFTSQGNQNELLNQVLRPQINGKINFIANEVICSFSERKMDLLFGTTNNKCLLIELKNEFIFNSKIYYQLKEYSQWISAYKLHYKEIIPILILKEPRELAPRKGLKYFKYLSNSDKNNNLKSEWYKNIINDIENAKMKLKNENISKLSEFKIYTFETDNKNKLLNFKEL